LRVGDLLAPLHPHRTGNAREPSASPDGFALARRLVRRVYLEMRGSRQQLTAQHVADVIRLAAKSQSGSRIELPGLSVERVFNRIVFWPAATVPRGETRNEKPASGSPFEYEFSLPRIAKATRVVVPEIRRRFDLKVVDWPSAWRETMKGTTQGAGALDFERLRWPLVLRNWRPGDSYRPHRRGSVRKLKRLLLEGRVPVRERAGWPVLTSAGALVWASGCPVAHEFAPRPETRVGLVIAEEAF
jgi:tRNA(Ile)-lysidine synthase